jgi:hypothetical protein
LNEVADGRTVDGMTPGDWLFSQPVANIAGASGAYLVVRSFHSYEGTPNGGLDMNPTVFEVGAFVRMREPGNSSPIEKPIPQTDVTVSIEDCQGEVVYETTIRTNGAGVAELPFRDTRRTLARGAHLIRVRCTFEGHGVRNILDHQMYITIVEKVLVEDTLFDGVREASRVWEGR